MTKHKQLSKRLYMGDHQLKKGDALSLPKGWEIKKLGEVCETGAGGTPLKNHKEFYENGNIPWLRSGEVGKRDITDCELCISEEGLNNSSAKLFPTNTVLIAMYGATAGQVGILRFECSTNQAVCGILPNENFIPEFLYYKFLAGKDALVRQAVGGAQPNISQIKIKNTLIPAIPLPEQQRIVKILDKAFVAIDQAKQNAQRNLKNAKALFESYLQRVFENKGDDWEVKKLGDLCKIQLGKTPHRKTIKFWDKEKNTSNVWLSISDMVHGEELFDSKEYVSNLGAENINITPKGTLMLSFKLTLGRVSFSGNDLFTNEAIASLINLSSNISKKYLFHYFTFFNWNKATDGDIKVKGRTLNKEKLKSLSIIVPPLPEQQCIVKKLDKLSSETKKLEAIYQQKINDLEELKKSVLNKVFKGKNNLNNIIGKFINNE